MKEKGWRPFWAALLAALLVLLPLVGGTVLLTRRSLRTDWPSRPERRRHPSAEGREPPESAGLHRPHRDDSTRLSAALPECQPELHPCAGSARRTDRTFGADETALSDCYRAAGRPAAGKHFSRLSPCPRTPTISPLRRPFCKPSLTGTGCCGWLFGSADRRGAGPHRVQLQCAGHLGPGGRRTAQRDGGHCPARPQSRRPGGGVGRLFPAGAGASARCPAGRPAGSQLEPAHRFDGAGPAHLR